MTIETFVDGVTITLDHEAACALTTILGSVVDNTVCESMEALYNRLADEDYEVLAEELDYRLVVEENPDYDPSDEDDFKHVLRLTDKDSK